MILSERDKLKLAGIEKRHPLLFHFDRSLWPILFATMQLLGLLPWSHCFEDERGMKEFKFILTTREEEDLKKLAQKYPIFAVGTSGPTF